MTNETEIKKMNTQRLAEFLNQVNASDTQITTCGGVCDDCSETQSYCVSKIIEWLKEEID